MASDDVLRYDHHQAIFHQREAAHLRDLLAAILLRHPNGLFVPDSAVTARSGRDVEIHQDEARRGYVLCLTPAREG